MPDCGVCGDSFDSERGLSIHRSMAHGPPTRECKNCNDEFKVPPNNKDKKFCSKECYISYGNIETVCHTCESEITVTRSRFERNNRLFCSKECVNFEGKGNPFFGKTHNNLSEKLPSGEDHWMYGRDRPEHAELMKELHSGEDNPMHGVRGENAPNWQGGDWMDQSWRRTADWYEARDETLERDDHECQDCGKQEGSLHVHHIEPVSEGGGKFDTDNLITLCPEHHYKKHSNGTN